MKIISGGQTGADRAGLDAALALNIPHGGFCPKGRISEEGTIPPFYHLEETESSEYQERTEKNVVTSDGTLLLTLGPTLSGGTKLTATLAKKHKKPYVHIDLLACLTPVQQTLALLKVRKFLARNKVETLNVAGSRESKAPGIHSLALVFLVELLRNQEQLSD